MVAPLRQSQSREDLIRIRVPTPGIADHRVAVGVPGQDQGAVGGHRQRGHRRSR